MTQYAWIEKEGVTGRLIFHTLSSFYLDVVPRQTFASIIMKLNNAKALSQSHVHSLMATYQLFFFPLVVGRFLDAPVCFGELKVLKGNEALTGPFRKSEENGRVSRNTLFHRFGF